MLKINRLQIKIITDQGEYGVDEQFYEGLNFWQINYILKKEFSGYII